MSTAKLDYERAQAQLRAKEAELERERLEVRASLDVEVKRLERQHEDEKKTLEQKFNQFMAQAQKTLDETIEALSQRITTYTRQGLGKVSNFSAKSEEKLHLAAKEALTKLDELAETQLERDILDKKREKERQAPLTVGSIVKIKSMKGAKAEVLELSDTRATLQVGNFRMEKPLDDLELAAAQTTGGASPSSKKGSSAKMPKNYYVGIDASESVPSKLDLRGRRYDDALAEAERYIDMAFRSGAMMVTVITGHGTGALKTGLKQLLNGLPYIREFRPERQGDDGATLIEFER